VGQALRLADAGLRVAGRFFDHAVDALEDHPVIGPGGVVLPAEATLTFYN
jgi:hypothetical protein